MCFGLSDHLLISTWQILAISEIKGADAALDFMVSPKSTLNYGIAVGQGENGCCSKNSRWDPDPFSPCTKFTQPEEPLPQMSHHPREPTRQSQEPHRSPLRNNVRGLEMRWWEIRDGGLCLCSQRSCTLAQGKWGE